MKNILAFVVIFILSPTLFAEESVCNSPLYDPYITGKFEVRNLTSKSVSSEYKHVLTLSVTNNFPVPMDVEELQFTVGYEGMPIENFGFWSIGISKYFIDTTVIELSDIVQNSDNDDMVFAPNKLFSIPFSSKEPFTIPTNETRHFIIGAELPQLIADAKYKTVLDFIVIRAVFPEECVQMREVWSVAEVFIPPDIQTFAKVSSNGW